MINFLKIVVIYVNHPFMTTSYKALAKLGLTIMAQLNLTLSLTYSIFGNNGQTVELQG